MNPELPKLTDEQIYAAFAQAYQGVGWVTQEFQRRFADAIIDQLNDPRLHPTQEKLK